MSLIDLPDSDKNAYTEDGVQQILFSPFPKQAMFLASEVDEVLFGVSVRRLVLAGIVTGGMKNKMKLVKRSRNEREFRASQSIPYNRRV